MKLEELKKMIKEELDSFVQNENEDVNEVDVDVDTDAGDVDAGMGDMDAGEEGSDDILRQIYDMLKDKFEGEDMGDEEAEDVEGEEDPDADLEENSTTDSKFQKTGMAPAGGGSAGANVGYETAKVTRGSTGYDAGSKALQERFKKLANIIKG